MTQEEAYASVTHDEAQTQQILADRDGMKVFVDGQWRRLCRTDLMDNVRTSMDEKWLERHKHSLYGARMGPDYFAIIDSWSDG